MVTAFPISKDKPKLFKVQLCQCFPEIVNKRTEQDKSLNSDPEMEPSVKDTICFSTLPGESPNRDIFSENLVHKLLYNGFYENCSSK